MWSVPLTGYWDPGTSSLCIPTAWSYWAWSITCFCGAVLCCATIGLEQERPSARRASDSVSLWTPATWALSMLISWSTEGGASL